VPVAWWPRTCDDSEDADDAVGSNNAGLLRYRRLPNTRGFISSITILPKLAGELRPTIWKNKSCVWQLFEWRRRWLRRVALLTLAFLGKGGGEVNGNINFLISASLIRFLPRKLVPP